MMHSVKVTRKNSSNTNDLISYPQSMITYPQPLQQMYYPLSLPYYYSDYDSDFQRRSSILQTSDHSLSIISQTSDNLTKKMVTNMEDFLDQEFNLVMVNLLAIYLFLKNKKFLSKIIRF